MGAIPVREYGGVAEQVKDQESYTPIREHQNPFRWISYCAVAFVVLGVADSLINNPRWEWGIVGQYLFSERILAGLLNTLILTVVSSALGLVLGGVIASFRLSTNIILSTAASLYIWLIRAIPTLVMLLLIFFMGALVPQITIGIPFTAIEFWGIPTNDVINRFSAAVIGLALYLGGYSAEIFRSGFLAVPHGQSEAASALGMGKLTALRVVLAPQAIRVIIPPLGNELITMFKSTSLVSVIGYVELLTTAQLIYSTNFETIPLLTVVCIWYLFLTSIAMFGQSLLEKRYGRGMIRGMS